MSEEKNIRDDIEIKLRKSIAEVAEIDMADVKADDQFRALGIDSMMALQIMADMERELQIEIQESDLKKFLDIKSTIDAISQYVGKK